MAMKGLLLREPCLTPSVYEHELQSFEEDYFSGTEQVLTFLGPSTQEVRKGIPLKEPREMHLERLSRLLGFASGALKLTPFVTPSVQCRS